jgi:threonine dehydratase
MAGGGDPAPPASAPLPAVTIDDVRAAAAALAGVLPVTPLVPAGRLSADLRCEIRLKLETQHHTGSFKERGAFNLLRQLSAEQSRAGVIAMSAGNHAQGVAYHAGRLGIPTTIVMPRGTPFTKIERTRAYGATVTLEGETLSEAESAAQRIAADRGLVFVHPYDDPRIVAGQGTVALEMLEAWPEMDTLVVPIGGGGLIAGIALAAKAMRPAITIVGVQTALYPAMARAVRGEAGETGGTTLAEGIAVKRPGTLTTDIVRRLVDRIDLVDEAAIEEAVERLATTQKLVAEGAGAAGVAALIAEPTRFVGQKVGVVVCGGNVDPRILASILMRGLVRAGRMVRLRIGIADQPGVLARVTALLGAADANIVDVNHHRMYSHVPVKMAEVDVTVETRDGTHVDEIVRRLAEAGFSAQRMRDVD